MQWLKNSKYDLIWWFGLIAITAGAVGFDWRVGSMVGGFLAMASVIIAKILKARMRGAS